MEKIKYWLPKILNGFGVLGIIYLALHGKHSALPLILGITFGNTSAPSNFTEYLDSVFASSLQLYRKKLTDNIAATNAFLYKLLDSDFYESAEGGKYIEEGLMYGLAPADTYDGYDELSTVPTDGVTAALYEWRQMASPIAYNMKEVLQNRQKIVDIVKTRISQSELGIQEAWAQQFFHGAGNGAGRTPKVSGSNGSSGIEPLNKLIDFTPTTSTVVGNINQSTSSWWQNKTKTANVSTYEAFMLEMDNAYNSAALGTGGPPDLIIVDQITYELVVHAYFQKYRTTLQDVPSNFPFEAKKFKQAYLVMDDKVGDAYSDLTSAATYGTAYFLNTKFFRVRYDPERNWTMLKDENGKTFAKPINGDSRVGHVAWMGNVTCNNRRKQMVYGKIPRTLT
jgi:hypothetical protein